MSDRTSRVWWPFKVIANERQTDQHRAEIDFLVRATDLGSRAYVDGSDFGAVAGDGRECRIVWRGGHRRELLLIDGEKNVDKKMFASPDENIAFKEAADAGIAFLEKRASDPRKAVTSVHRS